MQPMWIPAVQLVQISLAQADDACARLDIGGGLEHLEAGAPRTAQLVIVRPRAVDAAVWLQIRAWSGRVGTPGAAVIEATTNESDTAR